MGEKGEGARRLGHTIPNGIYLKKKCISIDIKLGQLWHVEA